MIHWTSSCVMQVKSVPFRKYWCIRPTQRVPRVLGETMFPRGIRMREGELGLELGGYLLMPCKLAPIVWKESLYL